MNQSVWHTRVVVSICSLFGKVIYCKNSLIHFFNKIELRIYYWVVLFNMVTIMLLLLFIHCTLQYPLFAGNGIAINTYTEYNGMIVTNCTTYDDCYEILCVPLMPDDYLVVLKPNYWPGDCNTLGGDDRKMDAEMNMGSLWYNISTVSELSVFLCENWSAKKIIFYLLGCG